MKILSMTATFGKLENQTLTLEPGLNIIQAPNEWGKSTWCAFLLAMLYGIDTRERTRTGVLADKEHYAPWSGSPMAGSLRLLWQGRDITVERSSKGRGILNQFHAFETGTGLPVPELTADNCGQVLLGVEKSVFLRSGFIRQTDLPVTEDPALWRRLNALVTTGDESGTGDMLSQKLRELKNRCQSNRTTGLIPQALAQKRELEGKLRQLQQLGQQISDLHARQQQVEDRHRQLQNHKTALAYDAERSSAQALEEALLARAEAQAYVLELEAQCRDLPDAESARQSLQELKRLEEDALALEMEQRMLPQAPEKPADAPPFDGVAPEDAVAMAILDGRSWNLQTMLWKQKGTFLLVLGLAFLALAIALWCFLTREGGMACLALSVLSLALCLLCRRNTKKVLTALTKKYNSSDPDLWQQQAREHARKLLAYEKEFAAFQASQAACLEQRAQIAEKIAQCTGAEGLGTRQQQYQQILDLHHALAGARREAMLAARHADTVAAMAKPIAPPAFPDTLTFTLPETARLLSDCTQELEQLHRKLGHCQGQMEALGDEGALRQQLEALDARLARLEETYDALELAQQALQETSLALQRRFAPRITKRTKALFCAMTGGKYTQLTLDNDLQLSARSDDETTLRSSLWRSDGTADQLYLSLRLAVAEVLTPAAPLILDDVLVRFDDTRLATALEVLQTEAQTRQVLLFTCQSREQQYLNMNTNQEEPL